MTTDKFVKVTTFGANIPPGAKIIRRRRYNRPRGKPLRGWTLIIPAAKRLKIWDKLSGFIVQQLFAKVCYKCDKRLESQIRAECVIEKDHVLMLRMTSSSTAATFHYIKDVVLNELNEEIRKISNQYLEYTEKGRTFALPIIKQIKHSIGPIQHLPDHKAWTGRPKKPEGRKKPQQHVDVEVVATIGRVQDAELRALLSSLYSTAIAATQPERGTGA